MRLKMNKLLNIILVLVVVGVVSASEVSTTNNVLFDLPLQQNNHYIDLDNYVKNSSTQQFAGDSLFRMTNVNLTHFRSATTPISYDPASNLLSIAMIDFIFDDSGVFQETELFTLNSNDGGGTWDRSTVFRDPNKEIAPMIPSIALTNASKTENIEDVLSVFYAPIVYRNNGAGMTNTGAGGGSFVFYSPDFDGYYQIESDGPESGGNDNDPQYWNVLGLSTTLESDHVIGYGTLDPESEASQYGYYGYWGFDFDEQQTISNNPEEWWTKHFRQVESKTTSFNAPIKVGEDSEGTLYSVVNNIFATDEDTRVVAISKSTDKGENWSSFEQIPTTAMTDFIAEFGGYTDFSSPASTAYQGSSQLFVRGINDISYITRVYIFNPDDEDLEARYFIVDIRYNDGSWSVNPIVELETFGPPMFTEDESTSGDNDPNNEKYDLEMQNPASYGFGFGNSVRITRTADGSNIVLYWIDGVPGKFQTFEPFNVYTTRRNQLTGEDEKVFEPIDSLQVFDIFSKVYNVDSDTWEETKNITRDDDAEYFFHIPEYIKSVDKAHILTYDTDINLASTSLLFNFPDPIKRLMWAIPPFERHVEYDARKPEDAKTSVQNTLDFNVELKDAYPNPVVNSSSVEIGFTLEKNAVVSLELFNSVGNKVSTIINNKYMKDNVYKNVNISDLVSGTYYYQLTVDGITFTKKLVVIK